MTYTDSTLRYNQGSHSSGGLLPFLKQHRVTSVDLHVNADAPSFKAASDLLKASKVGVSELAINSSSKGQKLVGEKQAKAFLTQKAFMNTTSLKVNLSDMRRTGFGYWWATIFGAARSTGPELLPHVKSVTLNTNCRGDQRCVKAASELSKRFAAARPDVKVTVGSIDEARPTSTKVSEQDRPFKFRPFSPSISHRFQNDASQAETPADANKKVGASQTASYF